MFGKKEVIQNGPEITDAPKKAKKPIYKRWWFWFIIVFLALSALGSSGNEESTNVNGSSGNTDTNPSASVSTSSNDTQPEKSAEESNKSSESVVWTTAQKNVMAKAKSYLNHSGFSYNGLVEQLEYEKFTHEDAVWAADNCNAD